MSIATANGGQVYYEIHGAGPAVVFSHGSGGHHAIWWQQVPHLSDRYSVVTLDFPGFGNSASDRTDYDTHEFPDYILAVLDDAGIDRAVLVGQSLGAPPSLSLAVRHPERVAGVVLTNSAGGIKDDEITPLVLADRKAAEQLPVIDRLMTKRVQEQEPARFRAGDEMAYSYKFHADHVGTLLRPPGLEDDEAITAAIRMQREAGLDLFTDGGFRRRDFWSVYTGAFSGFTPQAGEYVVSAPVEQHRRMTEGEAEFLRSATKGHLKVTLPAPGYVAERCWRPGAYASPAELGLELAGSVRAEIEALFAAGVIYVQLDNPGYTQFLNSGAADEAFERMLAADTAAVAGVARPDGASIGLHICRGSSSSDWLGPDGGSLIASRLLGSLPVDRFLLEYDDWRTGSLAPLRYVPEGKVVVLGMVGAHNPELEDIDEIVARVDEAGDIVDIDNISVSPDCGFASNHRGGRTLTLDEQFRKLRVVADIAMVGWGPEG